MRYGRMPPGLPRKSEDRRSFAEIRKRHLKRVRLNIDWILGFYGRNLEKKSLNFQKSIYSK